MSRIKGLFIACAVLSFLGLSLLLILQSWPQSIPWERDYQKALQQARKDKKPLVAYLFTDWCTSCQQMERETFSDVSLIRKIGQEYVWLKLNAETDQEGQRLQQEFGISGYPTTFVLDSEGQEVDRVAGYLPPRKFEEKLHHLINNPDSFGKVLHRAESEPQSTEAQYHLAESYLQRQDFEQAVLRFSRVIELDPENELGMPLVLVGEGRIETRPKVFPQSMGGWKRPSPAKQTRLMWRPPRVRSSGVSGHLSFSDFFVHPPILTPRTRIRDLPSSS